MRLAALTMVHNEAEFLKLWLNHYGAFIDRSDLYVITHGSGEDVLSQLEGCRTMYAPRNYVDWRHNRNRFALINAYANFVLSNYDGIIGGDVDELLFVDPNLGISLADFIAEHKDRSILTTFGLNLLDTNDSPPLTSDRPIEAQRRVAQCDNLYCKPMVAFREPGWSRGFHGCVHEPFMAKGLYMAHLKCADRSIFSKVAEERTQTFENFDNLGNGWRKKYWRDGSRFCANKCRAATEDKLQDLDDVVDEYTEELMSSVIKSARGLNALAVTFKTKKDRYVRLPERFSKGR